MKNKIKIWYNEEADYLEILLKKCKDTYFDETEKDYAEIRETTTNNLIGFAIFNFTKRKNKFIDLTIPLPSEAFI